MSPAKLAGKAAKKVASKGPAKAAKKSPKHAGDDARRVYEHFHRLRVMEGLLAEEARTSVSTLTRFAQAAFAAGQLRCAGDLLRAAEHATFAARVTNDPVVGEELGAALRAALKDEWHHRLHRAAERWDDLEERPAPELRLLFKKLRTEAKAAWKAKAYAEALEAARAADALAHATPQGLRLEQASEPGAAGLLP